LKILFYTDIHFRETSSYFPFNRIQENGLTGELNNILLGFDFLANQIKKYEPDLVINLGDSFQIDNYLSIRTIYSASLGMSIISSICKKLNIDHLILMGNHDLYVTLDNNIKITSICSLEAYGTIITNNTLYGINNFNLYLMPFTDNLEEGYQGILEGSQYNLIAAHMDFVGAVHDNNHPVEIGLDSHVSVPVICGHIHLKQQVGNITYPGSLIQGRFTRDNLEDAGGILIYDTDTKESENIQNNLSKHFVKVTDFSKLEYLDPERCILKVYSEYPEEEVKHLLKDYQYMYVTTKDKEQSSKSPIRNELDRPEKMLRDYIAEDKPEYVEIYDGVIKI
jgi:DNA repair exonuclease SbcCD nuclease subunit